MFRKMKFATQLGLSFGLILAMMLVLVGIGIQRVGLIDQTLTKVGEGATVKQRFAINFRGSVHDQAIAIRDVVLSDTLSEMRGHLQEIDRLKKFYDESHLPMTRLLQSSDATPEEMRLFEAINDIGEKALPLKARVVQMSEQGLREEATRLLRQELAADYSEWLGRINAFIDYQEANIQTDVQLVQSVASGFSMLMVWITLAATIMGCVLAVLIIRYVGRVLGDEPANLNALSNSLADGNLNNSFKDSIPANSVMSALASMQSNLRERIERDQVMASENQRIRQALDGASVSVMIADNDRRIMYTNRSVLNVLKNGEEDIREVLPHFNVDTLLNSSMDLFHKTPSHQANLLSNLTQPHEANIKVGKRHYRLSTSPILNAEGSRIGYVVEWIDRTQEVTSADEIASVVRSAAEGDFTKRINEQGKSDHLLAFAQGLNEVMENADRGLQDLARVLKGLSVGDLSQRIEVEYRGTLEELKVAANETADRLESMISEIREAAETIATASREISQGNMDLSSRTEKQAASLEETASSMEELTSTVKQNADNAKQANTLSTQASSVAREGGDVVKQVVSTMSEINESAQKIADIIGVIDGIAFQTNILALNAAVEAARAGDQGRGFAVVASEVRTLAQRSANAAKDIKSLISDSVNKIERGDTLVKQAGGTMKEILTAIQRVTDINAEITAASDEQASGIESISVAVNQMDEMTQQNAALVEEAAAAAESQQSQADELNILVSRFKLRSQLHLSAAPRALPGSSAPHAAHVIPDSAPRRLPKTVDQEDDWGEF